MAIITVLQSIFPDFSHRGLNLYFGNANRFDGIPDCNPEVYPEPTPHQQFLLPTPPDTLSVNRLRPFEHPTDDGGAEPPKPGLPSGAGPGKALERRSGYRGW